jgi:hypothetical protein
MPTLIAADRAFCGEFQIEVGMPAGSALRFPCRRRHGNRFLLVAVRRSQELPFGGRLQGEQLVRVREATLAALRFASLPRQLSFDPSARERWIAVYGPLSRGEEGLLGAATRRAEAHVVRLRRDLRHSRHQ